MLNHVPHSTTIQKKNSNHVRRSSSDTEGKSNSSENVDNDFYRLGKSHGRKELLHPFDPAPMCAFSPPPLPGKSHGRKELLHPSMPPMRPAPSRSPPSPGESSDSRKMDTYTYPVRQNVPDEPLPRPTSKNNEHNSKRSTSSSDDLFGIKRSTKNEQPRTTENFEDDFFQSNNNRRNVNGDADNFFSQPAQSTKTNSRARKHFFDEDDGTKKIF